MNYDDLKPWANPRQLEYIETIAKLGSATAAAVSLRVNTSSVIRSLGRLAKFAARHGYSPSHAMTRPVPDGYMVKGVSTYYDSKGTPAGQWVKSVVDPERQREIFEEAFRAMSEELPRLPATPAPGNCNDALANLYVLTDCHVGMVAWDKETQSGDWDLEIAERTLVGCFERMVTSSPEAAVGIVSQLGDFLHSDGMKAVTPMHGHLLDQDGRFAKVVGVAVRILRHVITFALQRHDKVIVLLAEGNHDMASSIWLRVMFKALYEKEPRVQVIDSELPYYVYQHGKTMLGWHHGHLKANNDLPLLFAAQFPTIWGQTTKRYAHVGHRHHVNEKEHSGMVLTQHSTLAARDAYASRGGWMSERQCTCITYHKDFGQVARTIVTPEMLSKVKASE